ncbi:hypothetical protein RHMOL_Rhmol04G0193400 [Rhododendron molle]|uniref:Uncharacterized protein n=1 Tax=Rhododendron molle TaxID=49168 RepID=A0ACC0P4M9_RHOML|nr:hypothetical protein RHMOL_Rhmol04G0193400 [Rhododendron molle]
MCTERDFKGTRIKSAKKRPERASSEQFLFIFYRTVQIKTAQIKPFPVIFFADFSRVPLKSRSKHIEWLGSSKFNQKMGEMRRSLF